MGFRWKRLDGLLCLLEALGELSFQFPVAKAPNRRENRRDRTA